MEFNIENLKRRSQMVAEESRPKMNTAKRIGELFYDLTSEIEHVYKKIKRRNLILCYLSISISIVSLILSIFKSDDITVNAANMLGVIVGLLAFLVTLLIGFQIYKAIEVEDTIDKKMSLIETRIYQSLKTYVDVKIQNKTGNS
jgi:hypothetical protein